MGAGDGSARGRPESVLHEIRVQGHLGDRWARWAEGLTLVRSSDGTTTLTVPLADQAALHGLLNRIRDLNVPIVSVRRVGAVGTRGTSMHALVHDEGASEG